MMCTLYLTLLLSPYIKDLHHFPFSIVIASRKSYSLSMSIVTKEMTQKSMVDECTPLLLDAKSPRVTSYTKPSIDNIQESTSCEILLLDPSPASSRNIVSVISILLLGAVFWTSYIKDLHAEASLL